MSADNSRRRLRVKNRPNFAITIYLRRATDKTSKKERPQEFFLRSFSKYQISYGLKQVYTCTKGWVLVIPLILLLVLPVDLVPPKDHSESYWVIAYPVCFAS